MLKSLIIPAAVLALAASSAGFADSLTCRTQKRTVVVDLNSAGQPRYRVWNQPHRPSEKPDLQIVGGTHDVEGTGPCTHAVWSFRQGKAEYTVSGLGCTEATPPAGATGQLSVWVDGQFKQSWWCF